MAEIETDGQLLSNTGTEDPSGESSEDSTENSTEDSAEDSTEAGSTPKDPTDLGAEISAEDLGIDLDSLTMNAPSMLGRAKPKPALHTSSSSKRAVGRPPKEDEGLFAWCEQFSCSGVEYLKLHRLYPKTWEGMSISEVYREIYEPIDEHWLINRWGGGSFQVEAYQRDSTGRSRKVQVKT